MTTHNTHNRQTDMPTAGFEPAIAASKRPQTHALDRATTGIGMLNPLNPELNPICFLLALLAYHFLHVSRIMVKSLTLRLLMLYIRSAYS